MKSIAWITGGMLILVICIAYCWGRTATRAQRIAYSATGISRIYLEHSTELESFPDATPWGIGGGEYLTECGIFCLSIKGKYDLTDLVRLAQHSDPEIAMIAMCLLSSRGHSDYLVRFLGDTRSVRFHAWCQVDVKGPIGSILGDQFGIVTFARQYDWQLALFGAVAWKWGEWQWVRELWWAYDSWTR